MTSSTVTRRKGAGAANPGHFAATQRSEPSSVELASPCAQCGTATKRTSGLCRKCDPARAARSAKKKDSQRHRSAAALKVDTTAGTIPKDEIGQCEFSAVPVYASGAPIEGRTRQCANAVRLPAVLCHRHGGSKETSLGRTVAKANAEADRGECFPLADEHWENANARLEEAKGVLLKALSGDFTQMARMAAAYQTQTRGTGTSRWSTTNQMLAMAQHAQHVFESDPEIDSDELWSQTMARMSEPHMTAKRWAEHGREINPDADGVAVIWMAPKRDPKREPGETDEEYEERCRKAKPYFGGHIEHRLSDTSGEPFDAPEHPLDVRPAGYGDPEKAISQMERVASDNGIQIVYSDIQPAGTYGYWRAADRQIAIWSGVAGGDRRAVAHTLAHELGHAMLGHSTTEEAEDHTADKEQAAEAFAIMATSHYGIDTTELGGFYIDSHRSGQRVDIETVEDFGPFRSALQAFGDFAVATGGEAE